MNRYSRITPSQFNPMSMQEIMSVPLAKQAMHDQVMSSADELGLFELNALEKDKSLRDSYINDYNSQIQSLTDDITSNGINNMSKQKLRALAKDKQQWLTQGQGKSIADNYTLYTENKKELDKLFQSGKITRDKYMLGLQSALNSYEGVANDGQYNPFLAVHDTDFDKKATEIAKAINGNPTKITQFSGLRYDPTVGKYIDIKTNREFTEKDAIRQAVKAGLMMDPEIMADLNQRQELGMLGNASVDQYVDALGIFNEAIYQKDNTSMSKQYVGMDHTQLDKTTTGDGSNYELGANRTFGIRTNSLGAKLGDIIEGKENFSVDKDDEIFNTGRGLALRPGNTTAKYDNLRDNEKQEYNAIFDKMQKSGAISMDTKRNSPEAMGAIKNYLNSFKDFSYQPIKYTNGLVKTYENSGAKFKRSTPKELADAISNNPEDRWFYDLKEGKEVSFEDLPEEHREQLMKGNGKVVAAHGARNDYKNEIGNVTVNDNVLTAPLELQLGDNHKYLVSRSQGEMSTPEYIVDNEINKIWSDIVRTPHLPNSYNLPYVGEVDITRLSNGNVIIKNSESTEILNSDSELEKYIKEVYTRR